MWTRIRLLSAFTALSAGLALLSPHLPGGIRWIPLACALGGAAALLTERFAHDRILARIVMASYIVRCALALTLFAISSLHAPILPALHLDYGLWAFGADGVGFHREAVTILDAWRTGIDIKSVLQEPQSMALLTAVVYWLFGASPLNFILVNAWLGAISGLLAYLIAARLGDRHRSDLVAATLVAFWPSSMLWSTQLLKDSVMPALILSSLLLVMGLWRCHSSPADTARARVSALAVRWIALGASVFALTFLRENLGMLLVAASALVLGVAVVYSLVHRQWTQATTAAAITVCVGVASFGGMSLDLASSLSPSQPEVGHVARGHAFEGAGKAADAIAEYRRAIELNPGYGPAHLALSLMLKKQNDHQSDSVVTPSPNDAPGLVTSEVAQHPAPAPKQVTSSDDPVDFMDQIGASQEWFSVDGLLRLRRAQVSAAGGKLVDRVVFRSAADLVLYLPRAFINAFLAPFPWQLMSTDGFTGVMRPLALSEIALLGLLLPAIVVGGWRRMTRFHPDEWMIVVFVIATALAYGLLMPNGGTLFRSRVQFLLPSLVLAAGSMPAFVYRLFDASTTREKWSGQES